ncbi:uncharacterized protein [Oscarella lobularis]|uniref:uncharacterized protein n=1 Tax=Oscarella lobularis TaxID=121494 RepID=UPI00331326D9
MRRTYSRSEVSEAEGDGLDAELSKLQRQYRIMEGDRKQYDNHAQNSIRKQRATIESLKRESEELMKDFRLAAGRQNSTKDAKNVRELVDLQGMQADYDERIRIEKEKIAEVNKHARAVEKKMAQQRKEMGGVHMSQQHHVQMKKQQRVMENRLDKALVKFNSSLAQNSELRMTIDHLRQERLVFERIHGRLEKTLADIKRQLGELIDSSTQAYESSEEARAKMTALKEKADKEMAQHNMEMKELMRVIEHDRKLREFMTTKDFERQELESQALMQRRLKGEGERGDKAEETLEAYEDAFDRIKEFTGIDDIDQLVARFIEVEDQNFALFNLVNELNSEIEGLQEQIADVKQNIDKFRNQGIEMEEQRKSILADLERQLKVVEERMKRQENRHAKNSRILDQLKSGVDSMFTKIGCDRSAITDMLGGQTGVTDANLMQFLGIIEQRVNELLQLQQFISLKESEETGSPSGSTSQLLAPPKAAQAQLASISIAAPSTGDDYDSEVSSLYSEEEHRPLTQGELKARILKGMARKEKAVKLNTAAEAPVTAKSQEKGKRKAATSKN